MKSNKSFSESRTSVRSCSDMRDDTQLKNSSTYTGASAVCGMHWRQLLLYLSRRAAHWGTHLKFKIIVFKFHQINFILYNSCIVFKQGADLKCLTHLLTSSSLVAWHCLRTNASKCEGMRGKPADEKSPTLTNLKAENLKQRNRYICYLPYYVTPIESPAHARLWSLSKTEFHLKKRTEVGWTVKKYWIHPGRSFFLLPF